MMRQTESNMSNAKANKETKFREAVELQPRFFKYLEGKPTFQFTT